MCLLSSYLSLFLSISESFTVGWQGEKVHRNVLWKGDKLNATKLEHIGQLGIVNICDLFDKYMDTKWTQSLKHFPE